MTSRTGDATARGLLAVTLLAVAPRLALLARPGAGRDEAAYQWWAHHPEPAYAPLLQALLRGFELLPLPALVSLRLPGLIAGVLAIALFARLLRDRGEGSAAGAVAAFAWTPWAIHTGGFAHPDPFLVVAVLGFAWADQRARPGWLGFATLCAAASKPTGLLLVPFALWRIGRLPSGRGRVIGLASVALAVAGTVSLSPTMIAGVTQFARIDADLDPIRRLAIGALSLLFLGGVLLPLAALQGLRRREPWTATRLAGVAFVVAFGAAALVTGQIKGNWILPGLLLLWPTGGLRLGRTPWIAAAAATWLVSAGMVAAFVHPGWVRGIEARFPAMAASYGVQAGSREAEVSASRSWSDRFAETTDLADFAAAVRAQSGAVDWIVSDDYGLAAQLSFAWSRGRIPIVLPLDPIFARSVVAAEPIDPTDSILFVGVRKDPRTLAVALGWMQSPEPLESVAHPITGSPLHLALGRERR